MRMPSAFLTGIVLASFLSLARGQGLVQIVLEGDLQPPGGARIEMEVAFWSRESASGQGRVDLGLHLAGRTSAIDVALLLERELQRAGAIVVSTSDPAREIKRATLFVEHAFHVGLRLGRGLSAQVCLSEGPPALVSFLSARESKELARFTLTSTTEHPHTKERARHEVAVELPASLSGEEAADRLTTAAITKGWTGEWFEHRAWRPQSGIGGARVTGTCIRLHSTGDWRLDVELERDATR
jgi:hypothetical protein